MITKDLIEIYTKMKSIKFSNEMKTNRKKFDLLNRSLLTDYDRKWYQFEVIRILYIEIRFRFKL